MSLVVTKAIWRHSSARGNARLTLLALADHVIEEKVRRGDPALAWPSQSTLAAMCRCSRSTIELALANLSRGGEIRDTGVRHWGKYRGTTEWEVLPGVDLFDDVTEARSPAVAQTDSRSGGAVGDGHLTDSRIDLTDSRRHLTDSAGRPDRPIGHKPGEKQEEDLGDKHRSAPAAPDGVNRDDLLAQRDSLTRDLERRPESVLTREALADVDQQLSQLEVEVTA